MKKIITVTLCIVLVLLFAGCGKNDDTSKVEIDYGASSVYSKEEIDSAIEIIKKQFASFEGCDFPQSWSAPNQTGDATPSPLRFGRCRANVHWTFCTPALATASYPFVDLPSGDTLRCKLFPSDKFHKIRYLFDR